MKISVVGIGNLLIEDDGVGIHAVQKLSEMELPEHVEVHDADSNTSLLLEAIDGCDKAVIIDAYESGEEPGTVKRFLIDTRDPPELDIKLSLHDMDFFDAIRMGRAAKYSLPDTVVIIGVEPGSLEAGLELSPKVKAVLPEVIEKIKEEF